MAQRNKCDFDATVVCAIPTRGNESLFINIFRQCLETFSGKWVTVCNNTWFPLPTLLCAGYSVKITISLYTKTIQLLHSTITIQ